MSELKTQPGKKPIRTMFKVALALACLGIAMPILFPAFERLGMSAEAWEKLGQARHGAIIIGMALGSFLILASFVLTLAGVLSQLFTNRGNGKRPMSGGGTIKD